MGEAEVFRNYLKLIHQLAGKCPRGLRPMMENLDELLTKLIGEHENRYGELK